MRRILKKINRKVIVLGAIVVALVGFSFSKPGEKYFEIARNLDIFASLFKEVNGFYVDEVDPQKMVAIGIEAMTQSLDPYTVFIPESETENFKTLTTGQYAGLGALIGQIHGKTFVTMIDVNYPAYKSGLKIGDQIIRIDGVDLTGKTQSDISHMLKGEIGQEVTLSIQRFGDSKTRDFKIQREKININNVPYFGIVTDGIGYIRLSDFTTDAGKEVGNALDSLKKMGAVSVILDLRGNPGGLLNEAINVCNVFIPTGKEVVSTKGKVQEWNRSYKTQDQPHDIEIPLAVLINRGTASAAEIVSGVMQDYDRGILIGQKSFGKGLVQSTRSLPYNNQLKVTTAKYYTPSGRCIQAIDYANRNEDGSVGKIPDSLKREFRTSNGRVVYDGGGIDPDIATSENNIATVTAKLIMQGYIFDYATEYYYKHSSPPPVNSYGMSDKEYNDFVDWMATREFHYETQVEKELSQLEKSASEEKYFNTLDEKIQELKKDLQNLKGNDFQNFKEEIKRALSIEIISRYHLEKGEIRYSLKGDNDIEEAIRILQNNKQYSDVLKARL